ncbi:hypothetical protein GCM10011491_25640 [Brucella endophytica]|uniref:Uncharacterized protein n=1 Tax=Brucella endophytica TaxID=1963359 RepID=A0A916SEE1_9HYPH|nr:hypothetical protein [Brucella endophytica]GGA96137.1 hypothetical protein GCM10011491_25640 [Brucella endophytica]
MQHLAAIMLLVTCSNDMDVCNVQPAPTVSYETIATCRTELKPALDNLAAEATRAYGKCVEVDPELMDRDPAIYWEIDKNDELQVTILEEHEDQAETARSESG